MRTELSVEQIENFITSLDLHISYVVQAGEMIGVDAELLDKHDASKYDAAEFYAYVRQFQSSDKDADEFAAAWLHHIHCNPHHWQHWIFADCYTPKDSKIINGVMRMPDKYVLEMIADWMGASMAYTDSFDMSDWLDKNIEKVILHPDSAQFAIEVLDSLGYADIVHRKNFNMHGISRIVQ